VKKIGETEAHIKAEIKDLLKKWVFVLPVSLKPWGNLPHPSP
jgi:hypothetical protein